MNKRRCTKPIRMWIDGQSYTIMKQVEPKFLKQENVSKIPKLDQKKEGLISVKFRLPSLYYIILDEYRDPKINVVESITNTVINYPKQGTEGVLEIVGDSEESIEEARKQLLYFIADIREQISAMQFISIPLLSDEIKQNFEKFKYNILAEDHQGVHESIFQSPLKLHLTVVVFTLLDDHEKLEAITTLQECKHLFSKKDKQSSNPIKVKVQGLNCMNNNLSKVNVLYAEASLTDDSESEKSLQEIVNAISDIFYEKGFVKGYQENVKLHMTVMNTKYRSKKKGSPNKKWIKRETFNATQIMEKYKNYYFGEAVLDTVYLSLMSSIGEDGFYTSLGSIKMFE